jgi:hypothetical protein
MNGTGDTPLSVTRASLAVGQIAMLGAARLMQSLDRVSGG